MSGPAYYLGCPVWACERWQGELFTQHARRDEWLRQYAQVFDTVEGNSTFYGLPSRDTILRWIEAVGTRFRFVLKFPRAISHEKRLLTSDRETEAFLEVLELLRGGGCLGPSFLQLPSGFSVHHLEVLRKYLGRLPGEYPYAVEVRNADFFAGGPAEQSLNQMLAELGIDRVIFDSRPLFSAPPETEFEAASQGRKPRVPLHTTLTGTRPIIRLIGRDNVRRVKPWIVEWSRTIAKWLHSGLQPFVFTHTPDERYAPHLARDFHSELLRHTELIGEMPAWPGERESHGAQQRRLF